MRTIAIEEHYVRQPPATQDRPRPLPEEVQARLLDLGPARIADMDAAGIDVQVLSLLSPGAQRFAAAEAAARAREENDRLADAVRRHPDRLAAFAAVPTADPAAAADELERAVSTLGFRGAMIHGPTEGRFLDDQRFWPILECAEALGVPIYLHPAPPPAAVAAAYYAGFSPGVTSTLATSGWGWHIETGLHVLRLVLAGAFDRFPRLQTVIGHLGEALPFMLARTSMTLPPAATGLQRTVAEYIRENVHMTTSGFFSVPPLLNALLEVGADRVLFAVDYPFSSSAAGAAFLDAMPVSAADREKIAHGNAERLLRL
ncbi:MAG TPA: amidohydrolase family protein [Candidatus Dormibacteraeota bacterium]|nr:amidohydrolase family protein [Candidatus Dormibacteraeota bacterium]